MVRQGRIIDIATAQPLDLAYLYRVDGGRRDLVGQADTAGRFSIDLPVNVPVKIRVERVGYNPWGFDVAPGTSPLEFQLEGAIELDPVVVERERPKPKPSHSPWILLGLVALFLLMDDE